MKTIRGNNVLKRGDTVFVEINSVEEFQLRSNSNQAAISRDFNQRIQIINRPCHLSPDNGEKYVQGTFLPFSPFRCTSGRTDGFLSATLNIRELYVDVKGDQILLTAVHLRSQGFLWVLRNPGFYRERHH